MKIKLFRFLICGMLYLSLLLNISYANTKLQEVPACDSEEKQSTDNDAIFKKIKHAVNDIWLVDTHEHLITEKGRKHYTTDLFYLMGNYFRFDLISAGITDEEIEFIYDENQPLKKRWEIFHPWWEKTKNTGYGLCVRKSVKGLFGINEINESTYEELNSKLLSTNNKDWYRTVLKDKAKVEVSIIDPLDRYAKLDDEYSDEFFLKVKRFDNFIKVGKKGLSEAQNIIGKKIQSFSDYLSAVDAGFQEAVEKKHIIGVKCGLAYSRSLYFEDVSREQAENIFRYRYLESSEITPEDLKKLQDFMMHYIVAKAIEYNLPIQIHTGMLAGNWNENPIENTNARNLSNLFLKFREAKFVIFHGNYPYTGELTYLAKIYPNVYIDMCWMGIISPATAKNALEEWLLTVPTNKIMAFGGDIGSAVEWVYGHAEMTREIVAQVLSKMVEENYYTEEEAIKIVQMILHDNAMNLFNIGKNGNHFYRDNNR